MAAITDAFTDTNGTLLESHVSPGGQTWSNRNVAALTIQSNHVESGAGSATSAVYEWNIGALSSNITWSMDYVMPLASPNDFFFSLTLRGTSGAGPVFGGYVCIIGRTAGVLRIQINEDSGPISSVVNIPSLDDGLTHTLTFTAQGGLLRAYIDGVLKVTAYSITYPAQGETRINVRNALTTGMPAGFKLDAASLDVAAPQPISFNIFTNVISRARTLGAKTVAPFLFLTGPHHNSFGTPNTQGGSSGGTPPPVTGQLWPRGQKSG
jgi:hypothetical protein